MHLEVSDGGDIFTASALVAYPTVEGMGLVFSMVELDKYEILSKWLSRIPRRSDRHSFAATAQVRALGAPFSHGPKISRYGARRAIFLTQHDLQDQGKYIESAQPRKGERPLPWKDTSRSEDAVEDAERGTSGARRSGP